MKASTVLLAISLAGNLVVIALFVAGAREKPAPSATMPALPAPPAAPADPAAVAAGLWAEIRSDDLRTQADNLRADGFPPTMVRAIVTAQIRARFAQRRQALDATQADRPFWKNSAPDPATQVAFRALAREEQQAIKDVLGPDPDTGPAATLRRQFPGFSDERIGQLAAIRERYDQQRAELYGTARGPGGMLPGDQSKIEALDHAHPPAAPPRPDPDVKPLPAHRVFTNYSGDSTRMGDHVRRRANVKLLCRKEAQEIGGRMTLKRRL